MQLVRDALKKAMLGRTCIVSSNDLLSMVQDVDLIYFIHKHRLHDKGTHQQLLRKKELFYRIYSYQMRFYESGDNMEDGYGGSQ